MTTYIQYQLTDGSTLLVEANEETNEPIKAGATNDNVITKAEKSFQEALMSVKHAAQELMQELAELAADEVEVSFGIKATGEAGFFAVCKAGVEANYTVTLRWQKNAEH